MTTDRSFIRIVRKLEQAELAHLRTLCADLQARLDAAEHDRDRAEDAAHSAHIMANMFQDLYYEALDRIPNEMPKPQICMDMQGHIGVIDPEVTPLEAVLEQLG